MIDLWPQPVFLLIIKSSEDFPTRPTYLMDVFNLLDHLFARLLSDEAIH